MLKRARTHCPPSKAGSIANWRLIAPKHIPKSFYLLEWIVFARHSLDVERERMLYTQATVGAAVYRRVMNARCSNQVDHRRQQPPPPPPPPPLPLLNFSIYYTIHDGESWPPFAAITMVLFPFAKFLESFAKFDLFEAALKTFVLFDLAAGDDDMSSGHMMFRISPGHHHRLLMMRHHRMTGRHHHWMTRLHHHGLLLTLSVLRLRVAWHRHSWVWLAHHHGLLLLLLLLNHHGLLLRHQHLLLLLLLLLLHQQRLLLLLCYWRKGK
jgi:hypothetical protein